MKKNKPESDKNEGHLGGFILGILAGATLGVLMAPEEGKKTRAKLEVKTRPLRAKAKVAARKVKSTPIYQEVSEAVEEAVAEKTELLKAKVPQLSSIQLPAFMTKSTSAGAKSTTSKPPKKTGQKFFRRV